MDGEFIVDTSHLVTYEPQLKLKVQLAGGIFSSFFGGEGLVTRINGKGNIVIRRSLEGLKSWLNPGFDFITCKLKSFTVPATRRRRCSGSGRNRHRRGRRDDRHRRRGHDRDLHASEGQRRFDQRGSNACRGRIFFLNHFTAGTSGGEVWLAQTLPGDMMKLALEGQTIIVQAGSFVASSAGVGMEVGWQGFRICFPASMFWLRIGGTGRLILSSYGAIYPRAGQRRIHRGHRGHIVAFDGDVEFQS